MPAGARDRLLVASRDHAPGDLLISVPAPLQLRYDNIEVAAEAAADGSGFEGACPKGQEEEAGGSASLSIPPAEAAALLRLFDQMPRGSDTGAPAWQFKQVIVGIVRSGGAACSVLQNCLG